MARFSCSAVLVLVIAGHACVHADLFWACVRTQTLTQLFFTNSTNLKTYVQQCSHSQAVLDESNSYVWPEVVHIPCDSKVRSARRPTSYLNARRAACTYAVSRKPRLCC